jgi:hypothetical protein
MNQPTAPPPRPAPPQAKATAPAAPKAPPPVNGHSAVTAKEFAIIGGRIAQTENIVLYGPGGIGKSTLAALAPRPVFLDMDRGTYHMDVPRVEGIETFADLRAALRSPSLDGYKTVVVDTGTKVEEMATVHTLATTPHEKGHMVKSIEGYGFGKGLQHIYDTFLLFLADLDGQRRKGRNVILICHECVNYVPNPTGDNFIRYEPHLQDPKSGKGSIRKRVIQWADHVLFVGYDVAAVDGKGKGSGTRTIYTTELPDHIAKSRTISVNLPFESATDGAIWDLIFGGYGGGASC